MAYPIDIRMEAKRLIVEEGRTPAEAAAIMGEDGPARQTVAGWASAPGPDGQTWIDLRQARAHERYDEQLLESSPRAIAQRLLSRIHELLHEDGFDTKKADALSKLTKVLRSVTDARHQLAMLYQLLGDFVVYLRDHHQELLTPALTQAIRDFKNDLRARLLDDT